MALLAIFLVISLAGAILFALAEASIFSLSDSRIRSLSESGRRGSLSLSRLRGHAARFLVLLRLGRVVSIVGFGLLSAVLGTMHWGIGGLVICAVIGSAIIVLLGELLPLRLALEWAVPIALVLAPPMRIISWIVATVLLPLAQLTPPVVERPTLSGTLTKREVRDLTVHDQTVGANADNQNE